MREDPPGLLYVVVNDLREFKHRDLILSTEERFQLCIGVDHSPVLGILKTILLDITPDLLDDLGSRKRFATHYFS